MKLIKSVCLILAFCIQATLALGAERPGGVIKCETWKGLNYTGRTMFLFGYWTGVFGMADEAAHNVGVSPQVAKRAVLNDFWPEGHDIEAVKRYLDRLCSQSGAEELSILDAIIDSTKTK